MKGISKAVKGGIIFIGLFFATQTVFTQPGNVTTFAGDGTFGYLDGPGATAQFAEPFDAVVDGSGNVFVADLRNQRIRKIDALGNVTTFAGDGTSGYLDGPGATAQFADPFRLAVDGSGNVFVADFYNQRIRKIDVLGNVTTFAGDGTYGFLDGPGATAQFTNPHGIAVDGSGNVFVADIHNERIRKIDALGNVTTLAGNGTPGYLDGPGASARFNFPMDVAVDGSGNVFVADFSNNCIRKIDALGNVTTFAGGGGPGYLDGPAATALFTEPGGVATDGSGNVFCLRNIQQSHPKDRCSWHCHYLGRGWNFWLFRWAGCNRAI